MSTMKIALMNGRTGLWLGILLWVTVAALASVAKWYVVTGLVFAQSTTTVNILPGSCVHIDNCILTMESGNRIWSDNPSFINELSPDGTIIYKCGSGMAYSFKWAGPAPSSENKINVNFTMEAKCTSSDGA